MTFVILISCIQIDVQNGVNFDVFLCLSDDEPYPKNSPPQHHKLAKSVTGHALRVCGDGNVILEDKIEKKTRKLTIPPMP